MINIFKIFCFIGILTILLVVHFKSSKEKINCMRVLKIGIDLEHLSDEVDPINIPTLSDAFYINHLYSNLAEYDENQNLKSSLAKNFYWKNTHTLIFEFGDDGPIKAHDAAFNLHRIVFKQKNLHGDLFDLICIPNESIDDCLNRIKVVDKYLQITIYDPANKKYLLNTLASIDYKMIPLAAFDSDDFRIAKIANYRITSGHYYLADKNHLKKNSFKHLEFFNCNEEFELVNSQSATAYDDLISSRINIVSTTVPIKNEMAEKIKKAGFLITETYPISVYTLVFSENAIRDFSIEERFAAGGILVNEISASTFYNSLKTEQFVQSFGQGYLNDEQLRIVRENRAHNIRFSFKPSRKIKLGVRNIERWKKFVEKNTQFELVKISGSALNLKEHDKPDIFALTNDVSFETDYALLTFAIKNNFLKLNSLSHNQILKKFLELESEESRIKFINELHYYSVVNAVVYPMYASPYTTITPSDIKANQSSFNSRTLLWLFKWI